MLNKLAILFILLSVFFIFNCGEQSLDGTWVGYEIRGLSDMTLTFSGDKLEVAGPTPDIWYKITFSIKEGTEPEQCEIRFVDASEPQIIGSVAMGILKIVGDSLTIAFNPPDDSRIPTSFERKGDTRVFILNKQ